MLLAIDAEFVMFSPEEKVADYGVETVTRPARLGLARISVLRGDPGPCSGGTLKPGPGARGGGSGSRVRFGRGRPGLGAHLGPTRELSSICTTPLSR